MKISKLLLLVLALPVIALAQIPAAPPAVPVPAPGADVGTELVGSITQLLGAAKGGQTALAVVVALIILSRLASKLGTRLPGKVGEWFATPAATWIFPMVLSIGGALVTTLAVPGAAFSIPVLLSAIVVGLASGGQGAGAAAVAQANKAGDAAAAEVKTVPQAAAEIRKGPEV